MFVYKILVAKISKIRFSESYNANEEIRHCVIHGTDVHKISLTHETKLENVHV